MEINDVVKIIKETKIPAGCFPSGSEWVISEVRRTLIEAVMEGDMPRITVAGDKRVVVVKGNERMEVSAREVWAAFPQRRTTVPCIRCYERGGQCTRNYPAGCKGHV